MLAGCEEHGGVRVHGRHHDLEALLFALRRHLPTQPLDLASAVRVAHAHGLHLVLLA
jgi:hypothetical protein